MFDTFFGYQKRTAGLHRACRKQRPAAWVKSPKDYAGLLLRRLKRTANATRLVKHSDLHPSGKIKKK